MSPGALGFDAAIGSAVAVSRQAYTRLLDRIREAALLGSSAAILHWDQETMMPPRGLEHRARQLEQLARLCHEWTTTPEIGDLLAECEADPELTADPESDEATNLREIRRAYDRATRLPKTLVGEIARTTSLAQAEWARARAASDFARFRPWLEKLVHLMREKARCLGWPEGGEAWDALADDYEPGITSKALEPVFTPLRARLAALVAELNERGVRPDERFRSVRLPVDAQMAFVRFVSESLGFDYERGRLDRSTHPFCGGSHADDVRITTRLAEDDLLDGLGSTMHESGHGIYEQGLPGEHFGTPRGSAASLGVHESQSRLWENHVGRSRAFWRWCAPILPRFFGDAASDFDADALYRAANLVRPGFIRVEADEATYDLHVMARHEIELGLLRGELEAADVPAEWNRLYRELLGLRVPDDRRGCLQDVHWSAGLFGYFPTYTLGNLYAAQLVDAARRALPDLDDRIERGDFAALREWLREHVHRHGQRWRPSELIERATGRPPAVEPYLAYLETKLREVYRT